MCFIYRSFNWTTSRKFLEERMNFFRDVNRILKSKIGNEDSVDNSVDSAKVFGINLPSNCGKMSDPDAVPASTRSTLKDKEKSDVQTSKSKLDEELTSLALLATTSDINLVKCNIEFTKVSDGLLVSGMKDYQMRSAVGPKGMNLKCLEYKHGVTIEVFDTDLKLLIKGDESQQHAACIDIIQSVPLSYEVPSLKISEDGLLFGMSRLDAQKTIWGRDVLYVPIENPNGIFEKVVMNGPLLNVQGAVAELKRVGQN